MPLEKSYGVLKGRAVERKMELEESSPHFQVHIKANQQDFRLAINVKSVQAPFDLLYFVNDNFKHPITDQLDKLNSGFNEIKPSDRKAGGIALDYIRGNLFDVKQMKPLPFNKSGADNDLNDLINLYIQRAIASPNAVIYAFGERFGPENIKDKIFHFLPGNGVHNMHMNQGSSGKFQQYNGVYQDGGLIIHFPARNQWVAVFFAFQSQSFHTDDVHGNPLPDVPGKPVPDVPGTPPEKVPLSDGKVRIIAALVNPPGDDVGKESVTLINTSPDKIDLQGWSLVDGSKRKHSLNVNLDAGALVTVLLTGQNIQLGNNGGIISLLDEQGTKIDGVSYTKEDASKQGWTIVF
jgi:uncharacterized protein YukJ